MSCPDSINGLSVERSKPTVFGAKMRFIDPRHPLSKLARDYLGALLARERNRASDLVMASVDEGTSIKDVYLHVLQPVQYEVGWLWQNDRISVGHEHYCTNSTQLVMSMLYPRLFTGARAGKRMLAACVQGELHELGLRMLSDFFEMEGWDTDYLGANMPREGIVRALEEEATDLLCIGVTMHYHLEEAQKLVLAVRESTRSTHIPILVGGYTFHVVDRLWEKVGADGTAENGDQALSLAARLTEQRSTDEQ